MDPGMAFGTGTHESTYLCAKLMQEEDCHQKKVIDAGCGSGILSMAAALMGSSRVLAVDVDPEAVRVAEENIKKNNLDHVIEVRKTDIMQDLPFKADIIVANLLAEIIVKIAKKIKKDLEPGGVFIASGILTEKKEMVIEELARQGFCIKKILEKGEWCAVSSQYNEKNFC